MTETNNAIANAVHLWIMFVTDNWSGSLSSIQWLISSKIKEHPDTYNIFTQEDHKFSCVLNIEP